HTFNYCASIVAYNKGNGQFDIEKLPPEVQFSSVNAIKLLDVDNDNKLDIITAGNQLNFIPQFGRLDASFGNIILNKGNKQLQIVSDKKSGLHILGQVNDMALIVNNKKTTILFLRNNDKPVTYSINK
ncbi:MAG: CRTAC1 family protein, partial [Sediminibacterium sp.]|nr:CRTAC1 family protein [Sediminibacterium sp.]